MRTPTIDRCATYFTAPDVAAIGDYYRDVLGFQREYAAGEPPMFAIYSRGAATVMFRRVDGSPLHPMEAEGGTWDLFCWVTGLDALFAELSSNGAEVAYPPTLQEYGMREFAVRDPLGRVLGFGEPADQPQRE